MTEASELGVMLASSFQASNLMPEVAAAVTALLGDAQYLRWAWRLNPRGVITRLPCADLRVPAGAHPCVGHVVHSH